MKKMFLTLCLSCITVCAGAQFKGFTEEEKNAFIQNEAEIAPRALIMKQDKFMEYASRYTILKEYSQELYELIGVQECRKICYEYIYPKNPQERWQGKVNVENDYKDSIFSILFLSGNDISSPNLHIAAKGRKALKLTAEQEKQLVGEAAVNQRRLEKIPRRDLWKQELEALQRILNEEQLDLFFLQKNSGRVMRNAKVYWQRLKDHNMTNDLDSATAVKQIYMHQLKIQKAADIYAYDDAKKREAWSAIDFHAPLPMKRVYSVNRKNIVKKQGYRGSFTW